MSLDSFVCNLIGQARNCKKEQRRADKRPTCRFLEEEYRDELWKLLTNTEYFESETVSNFCDAFQDLLEQSDPMYRPKKKSK